MFRAARLFLISIVVLLIALPAAAQDAPLPPLAAVRGSEVVLAGFGTAPQAITDSSARDYWNLTWSPGGNYLAFLAVDQEYQQQLMLYDRANETLTNVDSALGTGFPVRFSYDSSQLFYVKDNPANGTGAGYVMDFYAVDLTPNAEPRWIMSFDFGVGCGGGSSYPPDWRYNAETGGLGGFHLVLEKTPFGVVHSMDCGGNVTGLLDPLTGVDVALGELSRAIVSADRTKVAGITDLAGGRTGEKLIVVDLATQARTEIPTTETPDQVAWSAEGSSLLFYSARNTSGATMSFDADGMGRIAAIFGEYAPLDLWQVSIHAVDLTTGADTELYRGDGYAVGRMIATPDGTALLGSLIPNGQDWFATIASGALDPAQEQTDTRALDLVPVQLFTLPLNGGPLRVLATDLRGVALNARAYTQ